MNKGINIDGWREVMYGKIDFRSQAIVKVVNLEEDVIGKIISVGSDSVTIKTNDGNVEVEYLNILDVN